MFSFFLFWSHTAQRSSNDCISMDSEIWKFNNVDKQEENFIFHESSSVSYLSDRNRKKFSVNFCGATDESSIVFTDQEDEEKQTNIYLNISRNQKTKKYQISLISSIGKTVASKQYASKTNEFCFSLISGRGYVSVFSMPHVEGKEPLILYEMSIPRTYKLSFASHKESNVSKLCIGDFFGEQRPARNMDTEWSSHIRDFL